MVSGSIKIGVQLGRELVPSELSIWPEFFSPQDLNAASQSLFSGSAIGGLDHGLHLILLTYGYKTIGMKAELLHHEKRILTNSATGEIGIAEIDFWELVRAAGYE